MSGFPPRETSCTQPMHIENCAGTWLIHPRSGRGLGGTKARVAYRNKHALGLVFVHSVDVLVVVIALRYLFVAFGTLLSSLDAPNLALCCLPGLCKESYFRPNQMSPLRITGFNLGKPLAHNQCTESIWQPLGSFALFLGET